MKKEIADKLAKEYDYFWRENLRQLPDGWLTPLLDLFEKLYRLSATDATIAGALIPVALYVEIKSTRAFAFASPTLPARWWTDARRKALVDALADFQGQTMKTCQVCGSSGVTTLVSRGDLKDGVYCGEHTPRAADLSPKMSRADALYAECRDLFPPVHGSAINLDLPDYLLDLVASTFRKVLKLVIEAGVVGKVLVTRVEMDDGALFVRVQFQNLTAVNLSLQMTINELISDLEVRSDEAIREQGGADAAS